LDHDSGSLGDQLAAEHAIDSNATVVTEGDGFGPRVALLEEDVLKIGRHEAVLNRVAVVVECLHDVLPPALA